MNPSQSITIKGFLRDSNNKGIGDQTITFDGTGVSDSQLTATSNNDGSGSFSVPVTAPNTVSTDLEVKHILLAIPFQIMENQIVIQYFILRQRIHHK